LEWLHGGRLEGLGTHAATAAPPMANDATASDLSASVEAASGFGASGQEARPNDAEDQESDDDDEFGELEVGSVGKLLELQAAAARVKALLHGNVPRSEREGYEQHLAAVTRQAAKLDRTLGRRRWAALAHGLRAYDGVARVCKGVSGVGTGNAQANLAHALPVLSLYF